MAPLLISQAFEQFINVVPQKHEGAVGLEDRYARGVRREIDITGQISLAL